MSGLLKDKFYGLTIGCAIGDCMGSAADLLMQEGAEPDIKGPEEAEGYWNEATTLMLCQAKALDSECEFSKQLHNATLTGEDTSTGDLTNISSKTLAIAQATEPIKEECRHETDCLPLMGAVAMHYYRDFKIGIKAAYNNDLARGCSLCMDACKFYYAVLDLALHGCSKQQILNPASYANLSLCPEIQGILPLDTDTEIFNLDGCDEVISCLKMVLYTFRVCDDTEKGLGTVVNNSLSPVRTGALMGQLCGAYYGLTDIKEEWLDVLKSKSTLTAMVKGKIEINKSANEHRVKIRTRTDSRTVSSNANGGSNSGVSS